MSKKTKKAATTPDDLAAQQALRAAERALDAENERGRMLHGDATRLLGGIALLGIVTILVAVPSVAVLAPEWPAIAVLGVLTAALLCLLAGAILTVVSGMGPSAPASPNPSEVLNSAGLAFSSAKQLAAHVVSTQKSLVAQARDTHDAQEGTLRTVRVLMLVALGLLCAGVGLVLVLLILAMVL